VEGFVNSLDSNLIELRLPANLNDYHRFLNEKMESVGYWKFYSGRKLKGKVTTFLSHYHSLQGPPKQRSIFIEDANLVISLGNNICGYLLVKKLGS